MKRRRGFPTFRCERRLGVDRCCEGICGDGRVECVAGVVFTTTPSWVLMDWRIKASCRADAGFMASGFCCQSCVLPSMSVKRNVTVPSGSSLTALCGGGTGMAAAQDAARGSSP